MATILPAGKCATTRHNAVFVRFQTPRHGQQGRWAADHHNVLILDTA